MIVSTSDRAPHRATLHAVFLRLAVDDADSPCRSTILAMGSAPRGGSCSQAMFTLANAAPSAERPGVGMVLKVYGTSMSCELRWTLFSSRFLLLL
jgi:hypothetical protein